jgi:hypothetical protein
MWSSSDRGKAEAFYTALSTVTEAAAFSPVLLMEPLFIEAALTEHLLYARKYIYYSSSSQRPAMSVTLTPAPFHR